MATERARTLVADDEPDIRRLWQVTLTTSEDFVTAGVAENGLQAVELAEALQPDLVLLDVTMPVLDGIDATYQIRAVSPVSKVVLITAQTIWAMNEERIAAAGADAVLMKTLSPAQLLAELRKVMSR